MHSRLKVLLSAYSCEPGKGSEPEVGWRWATCLARLHNVTVVTRTNNRAAIEDGLRHIPPPHPCFEYYDLPSIFLKLKKAGLPVAIYYLLWQLGLRLKYHRRLRSFEMIHHITFNSFRQPGFWWFCPAPVVLGPLGGGQICPWRFFALMRHRRIAEFTRSCSVIASQLLPHVQASFASASSILVVNKDTEQRIPGIYRHKIRRMLETGIPPDLISPLRSHKPGPVRVLWLSWFIPIKAPELAIRAFALAHAKAPTMVMTMAGDGPLKRELQTMASSLGVAESIKWTGRINRSELKALFADHDVFMFTSLRDTSGNVLLEAMASGLPSIVLAHQGILEIATSDTAIMVPPLSPDQTLHELSGALLKLAGSPDIRDAMGRAALKRIQQEFLWERKAEQMHQIYTSLQK